MGKIDDKPRRSNPIVRGGTSSNHGSEFEPTTSQNTLSLKSVRKLQNHGIQAESGTPSNFVRTESSPVEYLKEIMDYQQGDLNVSVRGNRRKVDLSPCAGIKTENQLNQGTDLKEKVRKAKGVSTSVVGLASVKPNQLRPGRTEKILSDLHIGKHFHELKKFHFKEHGKVICGIILKNFIAATVMCTRLYKSNWGLKTFFSLMFLLLRVAASMEVSDVCKIAAVETMRVVPECPTDKLDWDTAAHQMNCKALVPSQCTTSEYHCVVNGFGNATIEVCADPKYIQPRHCPEFNERGRIIQHRPNFLLNYGTEVYKSTVVYIFPQCFDKVNNTGKQSSSDTTLLTKPLKTTVTPAHSTPRTDEESDFSIASFRVADFLIFLLIGISVPVFIFAVLILCICARRPGNLHDRHAETVEDTQEQNGILKTAIANGVQNSVEDGTTNLAGNDYSVQETEMQPLGENAA